MKTKAFPKIPGMVIAVLAVLGVLGAALATPAWAGERVFTFVSFSQAAPLADGTVARAGMQGSGTFNAEDAEVQGRGNFVVFNQAAAGVPKPILLSGTWKATTFVSYTNTNAAGMPFGSYGHIQAAILVLLVDLHLDDGTVISGATLRLICNIGAAGASTGEAEGYRLTIPGTPFGEFTPVLVPNASGGMTPLGITHLSTEQQED